MQLTDHDRAEAAPFAFALTLERVKLLQKKVSEQDLRISELEAQLSVTAISRIRILGRLNRVREALDS